MNTMPKIEAAAQGTGVLSDANESPVLSKEFQPDSDNEKAEVAAAEGTVQN